MIHRDISTVNKSSVTPNNDTVLVQFICYVQPTRFHDISTTPFNSHGYGHQILCYAFGCVLRGRAHWGPYHVGRWRGQHFNNARARSSKNTEKKPKKVTEWLDFVRFDAGVEVSTFILPVLHSPPSVSCCCWSWMLDPGWIMTLVLCGKARKIDWSKNSSHKTLISYRP